MSLPYVTKLSYVCFVILSILIIIIITIMIVIIVIIKIIITEYNAGYESRFDGHSFQVGLA